MKQIGNIYQYNEKNIMKIELLIIVKHILCDYMAKYLNVSTGEFYDDSDYETASDFVKKNLLALPDNEWQKAANQFIELHINKKDMQRFKDRFDISKSNTGYFWIEMEKLDLIYEWRSYFSDFLYEKAEKWCLENDIHYIETIPRGDFFAD